MVGAGVDDLVSRFNIMSSSKLFAVCEELKAGDAKNNMDKLKNLAGATYVTFEGKFTDAQRQVLALTLSLRQPHEPAPTSCVLDRVSV
jgi:hypothetical protein